MITVQVVGRLGRNAEGKSTASGKYFVNFSVASSEGKDRTTWLDVQAWGQTAELIEKYFKKGDMIALSGVLQANEFTKKDGTVVKTLRMVANQFAFCGSKQGGAVTKEEAPEEVKEESADDTTDIPF